MAELDDSGFITFTVDGVLKNWLRAQPRQPATLRELQAAAVS
jgi:hypothetical protein